MQEINWTLVDIKQNNLADAMGFAHVGFGDDAVCFFEKFKRSGYMTRFERGDGRVTSGCSGCELVLMIYDRLGRHLQSSDVMDQCSFDAVTAPIEYWIGYALGYLQGRSGLSFNRIFRHFPPANWYKMYSLHEVSDEALWNNTLGKYVDEEDSTGDYDFGGREHPFSNYYPAPATYEGIAFSSGECAFQAAKTLDLELRRSFSDIDPGKAKGRGRKLELRDDWEEVKYGVMLDILRSKFRNPLLRTMLLDTGQQQIVENTSDWHDNEWGDCRCEKCRNIPGKNLLGKALMELRDELSSIELQEDGCAI